jgi:hypothetical protein
LTAKCRRQSYGYKDDANEKHHESELREEDWSDEGGLGKEGRSKEKDLGGEGAVIRTDKKHITLESKKQKTHGSVGGGGREDREEKWAGQRMRVGSVHLRNEF